MLQSVLKKKAHVFLFGEMISKRKPREDLLTDCIFGFLRYLSKEASTRLLKAMLGSALPLSSEISHIERIELWDRKPGCEPDVIIDCVLGAGAYLRVIVENKLGSSLSLRQAEQQWKFFAKNEDHEWKTKHVFIVPEWSQIEFDLRESVANTSGANRSILLWRTVHKNLCNAHDLPNELRAWAVDVCKLLEYSPLRIVPGKEFSGEWSATARSIIASEADIVWCEPVFLQRRLFLNITEVEYGKDRNVFFVGDTRK